MTLQLKRKQKQQQIHVVGSVSNPSSPPPLTLDLLIHHSNNYSLPVELEEPHPLPLGCQRFLDLKSGEIYYKEKKEGEIGYGIIMSRRHGKSPKLDLKLNLSPPPRVYNNGNPRVESPNKSGNSSPISPPISCVSSENNSTEDQNLQYSNSPEATSMVVVGCPRCLMYVMLSEDDPKCPKCKSSVLLDFLHDNTTKKSRKNN